MNSTNAIEKALQEKVNEECRWIVDKFILDIEKLSDKYGGSNYYEFTRPPMNCLLYTSPSPRDKRQSRMPSSA